MQTFQIVILLALLAASALTKKGLNPRHLLKGYKNVPGNWGNCLSINAVNLTKYVSEAYGLSNGPGIEVAISFWTKGKGSAPKILSLEVKKNNITEI
ncbi:Hypothetical predicted protein, partial [Cloeon dipterum]